MAIISGTSGANTLYDTPEQDEIDAGAGDDLIIKTHPGADYINGGAGADHLFIDARNIIIA